MNRWPWLAGVGVCAGLAAVLWSRRARAARDDSDDEAGQGDDNPDATQDVSTSRARLDEIEQRIREAEDQIADAAKQHGTSSPPAPATPRPTPSATRPAPSSPPPPPPTGLTTPGLGAKVPGLPGRWVWPVSRWRDGRAPVVSDGWGSARDAGQRRHAGVDIMYRRKNRSELADVFRPGTPNGSELFFMADGEPALAASDGEVRWAAKSPRGHEIVIRHAGGAWGTYYQHLELLYVQKGDSVVAGQPIGVIGGNPAQAPHLKHLHFELRRGAVSRGAIDPSPLLAAFQVLDAPAAEKEAA